MGDKEILENGFAERDEQHSGSSIDKVGYVNIIFPTSTLPNLSFYLKQVKLSMPFMCMEGFFEWSKLCLLT